MVDDLTLDEAIELLKKVVTNSEVRNQKHIDLTLASASLRPHFQRALVVTNKEVEKGNITREELLKRLGLK